MMDAVHLLLSFCNLEFLVIGCKTQFSAAAKIRAFLCSGATYDCFGSVLFLGFFSWDFLSCYSLCSFIRTEIQY